MSDHRERVDDGASDGAEETDTTVGHVSQGGSITPGSSSEEERNESEARVEDLVEPNLAMESMEVGQAFHDGSGVAVAVGGQLHPPLAYVQNMECHQHKHQDTIVLNTTHKHAHYKSNYNHTHEYHRHSHSHFRVDLRTRHFHHYHHHEHKLDMQFRHKHNHIHNHIYLPNGVHLLDIIRSTQTETTASSSNSCSHNLSSRPATVLVNPMFLLPPSEVDPNSQITNASGKGNGISETNMARENQDEYGADSDSTLPWPMDEETEVQPCPPRASWDLGDCVDACDQGCTPMTPMTPNVRGLVETPPSPPRKCRRMTRHISLES